MHRKLIALTGEGTCLGMHPTCHLRFAISPFSCSTSFEYWDSGRQGLPLAIQGTSALSTGSFPVDFGDLVDP